MYCIDSLWNHSPMEPSHSPLRCLSQISSASGSVSLMGLPCSRSFSLALLRHTLMTLSTWSVMAPEPL